MKRIVFLLLAITTILANSYFFMSKNDQFTTDFFIGGQREMVYIDIEINQMGEVLEVLMPHLQAFSEEHQISIAQYSLFMGQDVNIYMTNIEANPLIQLSEGEYPTNHYHLSNRRFYEENIRQSGRLAFPLSNVDLRIYEFEQIRNIGFKGTLHLLGADEEIANMFIMETNQLLGEAFALQDVVSFAYHDYIFNLFYHDTAAISVMRASPLLTTILFSLFILFITTSFFAFTYRKRLMIEQLWGYGHTYSFYSIPKQFLPFYIGLTVVTGVILSVISFLANQENLLWIHISRMLLVNLAVAGIFYMFLLVGILLTKHFSNLATGLRGKSFFEKVQWISFSGKSLVTIILLTLILTTLSTLRYLREEFNQLAYWQQTEHVYHPFIHVDSNAIVEIEGEYSIIYVDGEEVEKPATYIDPQWEQQYINQMRELYTLLSENKGAFSINTNAFFRIYHNYEQPEEGWIYSYEYERLWRDDIWMEGILLNREELSAIDSYWLYILENRIIDIGDRHIVVDENYLERNPILATSGENVLELMVQDRYTQNVLVPESYAGEEEKLRKFFHHRFYADTVLQTNLLNEQLGIPPLEITREDLRINFIYTKSEQSFFSFNRYSGDEQSMIWDALAIVHHPELSMPPIDSMFFVNESRGQALESIRPFLDEVGTNEVQSVASVFAQGNEELIQIQWEMFQQTLDLIMIIIVSLMLCIVLIWAYYSANAYKINLKYLFGYSALERNSTMIFAMILANVIGAGILIHFHGFEWMIVVLVLVLTTVDFFMIDGLSKYLTKHGVGKVLKGGEL